MNNCWVSSVFFCQWLLLVSLCSLHGLQSFEKIAVCVTGQVGRWIPESHVKNLIKSNKDVFFSFFFNFEFANQQHQTTYNVKFGIPSNFTQLSLDTSLQEISELFTRNNSEFANIKFELPYELSRWQHIMNRNASHQSLDRISEYVSRQTIILNMYKNQISCMNSIADFERETQMNFTYVINAREDLYYFHPLDLRHAFALLNHPESKCGVVSKGCIMNYGINMRLQIARREAASQIFGGRLTFYKDMFTTGNTIKNPESFELFHVNSLGMQSCTLPVDLFPVASARIHPQTQKYCFLQKELQSLSMTDHSSSVYSCIPKSDFREVKTMRCSNFSLKRPPPPTKLHKLDVST
jgi:hypothetical protein